MSIRELIVRLFAVGRRGSRDRELQDELRFHLQSLIATHEGAGLSPADARAKAERELGGIDRTTQAWRDQRTWLPVEELRHDVTFGWRVLRRSPSFTVPAVLTMALAVAAATSVFTVVDAVLLAPLPYRDAGQVIAITETLATQKGGDVDVASGNFLEWQARARTLDAMTAIERRQQNLTRDGDPQQVHVTAVSSGFAPTIAVQPAVGRLFAPDEFQVGRETVVILSHGLWRARYRGDRDVAGKVIVLDDRGYTVVGVMPAGFAFPDPGSDVWVPLAFTGADRENRSAHRFSAMARLRHGSDIAAARREMDAIAEAMATESPASNRDWGIRLRPAREAIVGDTTPVLAVVAIAVALLLLVACANVAGLLLTQGLSRDREMAIRIALGAARARIVRQILSESVLLSLAGGALGLVLASLAGPLVGVLRPDDFVAWKDIGVDVRAGAFAIVVSFVIGALFGLLPAIVLSDRGLRERTSRRAAGSTESRARLALIGGEVGLAVVLVCGAAMFARTLDHLTRIDIGFRPAAVVTMRVSLPAARYGEDHQVTSFFERTLERVRVLPGVRAAGATQALPLGGGSSVRTLRIEGQSVTDPRQMPLAHYRIVTDGYLEAMGIPLRAGRTFTASDGPGRPMAVIINETMRQIAWGTREPIGTRVTIWGASGVMAEVVGVVGDVRHFGPSTPAPPEIYWPAAQIGVAQGETIKRARRNMSLVVSTAGDPLSVVPSVRAAVQEVDADQPIASVQTMASRLGSALWLSRASAWIVSTFGAAAFAFALLGVFGAVSYSVAQRRREIAVRLALGATRSGVRRLVLRRTLVAAAIGVAAGLIATQALERGFAWLIAGALPLDAATLAAVVAGSTALVLLACWLPARRASRMEPMRVLRSE